MTTEQRGADRIELQRSIPRLLAISSAQAREHFAPWIDSLVESGIDACLVREKHLDDRALHDLVAHTVAVAAGRIGVLVSGRADIALATGALGVHLPSDGVPVAQLRQRFGNRLLIGRSTHRIEEVADASDAGADYVTFGPIWDTPSKRGLGAPCGIDGLAAATSIGLPVLGLGGVDVDRLERLASAGAYGAAAIRMLTSRPSIRALGANRPSGWRTPALVDAPTR